MYRLLLPLLYCVSLCAADIDGFWALINPKTDKPSCVLAVYEYEGVNYGRIIGTYNDEGRVQETIDHPKDRATGVVGDPYYCGLDLIWDLTPSGSSFKGKIVDPQGGKVYNAEVWADNDRLTVRGKLLFFGSNRTGVPANIADFPKGFKWPNVKKFVPAIPEVK